MTPLQTKYNYSSSRSQLKV